MTRSALVTSIREIQRYHALYSTAAHARKYKPANSNFTILLPPIVNVYSPQQILLFCRPRQTSELGHQIDSQPSTSALPRSLCVGVGEPRKPYLLPTELRAEIGVRGDNQADTCGCGFVLMRSGAFVYLTTIRLRVTAILEFSTFNDVDVHTRGTPIHGDCLTFSYSQHAICIQYLTKYH